MDGAEYNTVRYVPTDQGGHAYNPHARRSTLSGNYLSSRFAQRHHDWANATEFVDGILDHAPQDLSLTKRAMVLAMGAGQYDQAIKKATIVVKDEPDNSLALLFQAMLNFKQKDYQAGADIIDNMPPGSLSAFIMPLLKSWAKASIGESDTQGLQDSTIHLYHAILIADYLDDHEMVKGLLAQSLKTPDISTADLTRVAGIYAHIGDNDKAKELYDRVFLLEPDNVEVAENLERLKSGEAIIIFDMVDSPEGGLAVAMHDMARVLYADFSDESARIFAHLALYLNPTKVDSALLLGHIATRNERYDEAINFYKSVSAEHPKYFDARRLAANLLEDQGDVDGALAALQELVNNDDNLEALIQIGDIHRRAEDFEQAAKVYNKVVKKLDSIIPEEYWQLHYVRGMSYEQMGEWDKAEADLLAALEFQPNNPYVLNYLGYSWADLGINLKKSQEMIEKAVELRPQDGYITDSLGWVLYKVGQYVEAVPHLERAVELLPYDPVINDHLGDAYWKVGRRLEARFQWERAKNHTDDGELLDIIIHKLDHGMDQPTPLRKEAGAESIIQNDATSDDKTSP
ncbi:MAG: tetratricopeptide repeat protein [Bdellovibrionales bacterium]